LKHQDINVSNARVMNTSCITAPNIVVITAEG
jgi:hypothetical protein